MNSAQLATKLAKGTLTKKHLVASKLAKYRPLRGCLNLFSILDSGEYSSRKLWSDICTDDIKADVKQQEIKELNW